MKTIALILMMLVVVGFSLSCGDSPTSDKPTVDVVDVDNRICHMAYEYNKTGERIDRTHIKFCDNTVLMLNGVMAEMARGKHVRFQYKRTNFPTDPSLNENYLFGGVAILED